MALICRMRPHPLEKSVQEQRSMSKRTLGWLASPPPIIKIFLITTPSNFIYYTPFLKTANLLLFQLFLMQVPSLLPLFLPCPLTLSLPLSTPFVLLSGKYLLVLLTLPQDLYSCRFLLAYHPFQIAQSLLYLCTPPSYHMKQCRLLLPSTNSRVCQYSKPFPNA